jgi:hypothetical protein
MAWAWRLFPLAIAACGDRSGMDLLDAAPHPLSLDLLVTATSVKIYTNGTDQVCACDDDSYHFTPIGSCEGIDDIISCVCQPWSCLAVELTDHGASLGRWDATPTYRSIRIPEPYPSDLQLHLRGCGHPEHVIALPPFVAPTPTLTSELSGDHVIARWQTDLPAASAYVEFTSGISSEDCHTLASEQQNRYTQPTPRWVSVTTLLPVETFSSERREVRVWRGARAGLSLL